MWDDVNYPPRPVQGFYKKAELELLIQRRKTRKQLVEAKINEAIVERYYQTRAIRRPDEAFEKDRDRKALVVMATGAGKTRTVIALCDLLLRWPPVCCPSSRTARKSRFPAQPGQCPTPTHQTLRLPTPHRFGRATPPSHPAQVLESTLVTPVIP